MHYHIKELTDSITGSALLWLREVSIENHEIISDFFANGPLVVYEAFPLHLIWKYILLRIYFVQKYI